MISGATLERRGLAPLMDVRALNLAEENELALLDHDCRLLVDDARRLAGRSDDGADAFASLTHDIADLYRVDRSVRTINRREGDGEVTVIGWLDRTVVDLRRLERNGRGTGVLRAKAIARRLRDALGVLAEPPVDGLAVFDACCVVRDVIDAVPLEQLLGSQVRHELRERRFTLLRTLVERRLENSGTGAMVVARSQSPRVDHGLEI